MLSAGSTGNYKQTGMFSYFYTSKTTKAHILCIFSFSVTPIADIEAIFLGYLCTHMHARLYLLHKTLSYLV